MKTDKTAAVVVTYNRLDFLKQCVAALEQQTSPCDILLIDNASTDGTGAWAQQFAAGQTNVFYKNTGRNSGGAGGFYDGIQWAVKDGYSTVWLMDDDCFPLPDALEKLLQADRILNGKYGWLSSVALWTDGTECKMNRQKLKKSFYEFSPLLEYGIVQAEQATFVSLFLRSEVIRQVGLPIKEFFIWGDDIEFTRRITARKQIPSFVVGQSQVIHAMKDNNGSSIATDRIERIERYQYAFRNENYLYRQEGLKGILFFLAKCGLNIIRILTKAPDHKWKRCRIVLSGMVLGNFFNPLITCCEDNNENCMGTFSKI